MKLTEQQIRQLQGEKTIFLNVLRIFSKGFLCILNTDEKEEMFREYNDKFKYLFSVIEDFDFAREKDPFQFGYGVSEYLNEIRWTMYTINPNMLKDLKENYERFRVNVNNIIMETE